MFSVLSTENIKIIDTLRFLRLCGELIDIFLEYVIKFAKQDTY